MAKIIHGFSPYYKLHRVCSVDTLRPLYRYLYIKNGNVYATDAHIAIAAPLSFVSNFEDEEKALLEGKLIHSSIFAQLLTMRETYVKPTENGVQFECKTKEGNNIIFLIPSEEQVGKFPNVDLTIANAKKERAKKVELTQSCVGLTLSRLDNIAAAMNTRVVELYLTSPAAAIIVCAQDRENEISAILMPCFIERPKL